MATNQCNEARMVVGQSRSRLLKTLEREDDQIRLKRGLRGDQGRGLMKKGGHVVDLDQIHAHLLPARDGTEDVMATEDGKDPKSQIEKGSTARRGATDVGTTHLTLLTSILTIDSE